jgi:uncharacterized protein (DUF1501 family)
MANPMLVLPRRDFLRNAALAGLAASLPRIAFADAPTDKRLVAIVLRGAMDGLNVVVPYGDRDYAERRGAIAIGRPGETDGATDLDGFFGLHPALDPIAEWYKEGGLLPIHAVASPYRDRSHFDGQDMLENGMMQPHESQSGWLNRAIGAMGGGNRRIGLALGQTIPLVLRGPAEIASWAPAQLPEADATFMEMMQALYRDDKRLGPALANGIAATAEAKTAIGDEGQTMSGGGPGANKAQKILAEAAGKMLAQPDGPRIASFDALGWDTHAGQGAAKGRLAGALNGLTASLVALRTALGPAWKDTIVVMATEFGRTVRANGAGGTDHGTGAAMLLAGGAVAGGKVLGKWPGLAESRLYQDRDLMPTTDLRAVLKTVLREHMGVAQARLDSAVFPGSSDARPIARVTASA